MMDIHSFLVLCMIPLAICSDGDLRITGRDTPYEGRLEVYYNGTWRSVCDDRWIEYPQNAQVACRQLGLRGGQVRTKISDLYTGSSGFWMDEIKCHGNESRLEDCPFEGWGVHDCVHTGSSRDDVYITCLPTQEGILRLIGGDSPYEGRLEVYQGGEWRSVCDDGWSSYPQNSRVACRQLGLSDGSRTYILSNDVGAQGFWMDDIVCRGSENRLEDCSFDGWGIHNCKHTDKNDVYLICHPNRDGVLQLKGGQLQHEGRLEIFHDGEWGTVCDDEWDAHPQNAQVACRQLGYTGGGTHRTVERWERGSGEIWMDDVTCTGTEARMEQCTYRGWGIEDCGHEEDIYVTCIPFYGRAQLVGGVDQYEGRLEVYHAGEWGSVCIDQWSSFKLNAHVTCRQLGFTGGTFRPVTDEERGTSLFWMDGVQCQGDEVALKDCSFYGWGNANNCSQMENDAVYVTCIPNKGDIRLIDANGVNQGEGIVEIFNGGTWNRVCSDAWDDNDAVVVCRQLGLNDGTASNVTYTTRKYRWTRDLLCVNNEEYLIKCPVTGTTCSSTQYPNATCTNSGDIMTGATCGAGDAHSSGTPDLAFGFCEVPYNAGCVPGKQCESNSICENHGDGHTCSCENTEKTYWNEDISRCLQVSLYNETCFANSSYSCYGNLTCQQTTDYHRCMCNDDQFWSDICQTRLSYNDTCDPAIVGHCARNMDCGMVQNVSRCLCNNDQYLDQNNTCQIKSSYSETCSVDLPDSCESDFTCQISGEHTMCLCNDTYYWNHHNNTCSTQSSFNETCLTDIPQSCGNNMICQNISNTDLCVCKQDYFWNDAEKTCKTQLWNNASCDPSIPDQCWSNLVCTATGGGSPPTCSCTGEDYFWDADLAQCQTKNNLLAVYIPDPLDMRGAITFCNTNHNGRLATEDHLQHVFIHCAVNKDNVWLKRTPTSTNEIGMDFTTCLVLDKENRIQNSNCLGTHAFVCIVETETTQNESCKGFPQKPATSEQKSATNTGLIAGVVGGIIGLIVLTILVIVIVICRRRRVSGHDQKKAIHTESNMSFRNDAYHDGSVPNGDRNDNDPRHTSPVDTATGHGSNDMYMNVDRQDYASKTRTDGNSDMTRAVVTPSNDVYAVAHPPKKKNKVKSKDEKNIQDKTLGTDNGSSQSKNLEEDYDTFIKPTTESTADDTYDHVRAGKEDTYGYDVFQGESQLTEGEGVYTYSH